MKPLAEAPYLDLFGSDFQSEPQKVMRELRQTSSVLRTPIGAVVVSRGAVHDLLRNRTLHSSLLNLIRLQGVDEGPIFNMAASSLLAKEGEDHTRLRRLVSRSFTPRAADKHRPFMRQLVSELTAQFTPAGRCEFMSEFADHYPVQVIAHLMGVPREDHGLFARWGDSLTHLLSLELSMHRKSVEEAQSEMSDYLREFVADRRKQPRQDLVSELIEARDGQDRLDDAELLSLLGGLLFAGYDTTRNQLGVAMTIFSSHSEKWADLAAHPARAIPAVEEIMRFAGVVAAVPRITTEDVVIEGYQVPAGTFVSLSLAGANHDPDVYLDPYRFDPDADHPEPPIAFGGGPHHCLGANLARAEMQEALPLLARAMPAMLVAEAPQWRSPLGGIAGPVQLRLTFDPG
jgi:cytochrome P450